jgi:hypothetical protein
MMAADIDRFACTANSSPIAIPDILKRLSLSSIHLVHLVQGTSREI